jgi:hypothetical protein
LVVFIRICVLHTASSDRSIGHYLQTLLFYVVIPISHTDLLFPG